MNEQCLGFDDIILVPQYSTLNTRKEADASANIWKYTRKNPIISSNMETVTDGEMAIAMWEAGSIGALHRFWSIEKNVEEYKKVSSKGYDCLVSVGVKEEDKKRAEALYSAGARMFIVDIAHGHSVMMKRTVTWLRDKWGGDIYIVGGNVATGEGTKDLIDWGVDAVKCNVGSGSVCTTRVVTGHGLPSITTIQECQLVTQQYGKLLIQDGGVRSSGDIVKSIAFGADMVMLGGLLVGCIESASPIIDGKKLYKGSAFAPPKANTTPEGTKTKVPVTGHVREVIDNLVGGIKSGMSYSNSRTLEELAIKSTYRIQTNSAHHEGIPHMLLRHKESE